jgi:hypothetical protein
MRTMSPCGPAALGCRMYPTSSKHRPNSSAPTPPAGADGSGIRFTVVDAFHGQHTRALKHTGREQNEKQSRRRDQSDRSGAPIVPVT